MLGVRPGSSVDQFTQENGLQPITRVIADLARCIFHEISEMIIAVKHVTGVIVREVSSPSIRGIPVIHAQISTPSISRSQPAVSPLSIKL